MLTCNKISWITNLIPKVGQWRGKKINLSIFLLGLWAQWCITKPLLLLWLFSFSSQNLNKVLTADMSYKILIQHCHCLGDLGKSNNQGQCRHNASKDISVEQSLWPLLDHLASSLGKSNEAKLPNPSRVPSISNISSSRSWRSNKCLIFSVRSLWSEASSSSICGQRYWQTVY